MSEDSDDGLDAGPFYMSDDDRARSCDDLEVYANWDASGAGELLEAFATISDAGVRKAVLRLVETMIRAGPKRSRRSAKPDA